MLRHMPTTIGGYRVPRVWAWLHKIVYIEGVAKPGKQESQAVVLCGRGSGRSVSLGRR